MLKARTFTLSSIFLIFCLPFGLHASQCYYAGGYDRTTYNDGSSTTTHYPQEYCTPGERYSANNPYTQGSAWYQSSKPSQEKQECLTEAYRIKSECNDAYGTLNNLCRGTNAILVRSGGIAVKKLLTKISDVVVSEKVVQYTKEGAAMAGLADSNAVIPCGDLDERATAYCKQGSEKMIAECNEM